VRGARTLWRLLRLSQRGACWVTLRFVLRVQASGSAALSSLAGSINSLSPVVAHSYAAVAHRQNSAWVHAVAHHPKHLERTPRALACQDNLRVYRHSVGQYAHTDLGGSYRRNTMATLSLQNGRSDANVGYAQLHRGVTRAFVGDRQDRVND